ncbi:MAG: cation transporter [Flavobacteriales bacterium]
MNKTVFDIPKMDCPSEENLIRMTLEDISSVVYLDFDLKNRKLLVYHTGAIEAFENKLYDLNLGATLLTTEVTNETIFEENQNQKKLLWVVLLINFAFFLIEMSTGLISESMGLVADSLDMLADSFVYGLSLFAVGGTLILKKRIAKFAGYIQIVLALMGFFEVVNRFIYAEVLPHVSTMITVSVFALIANGICLFLLQKSNHNNEAHMKASMIFTSNDVIINTGVILAGILTSLLNSNKPDLIIGTLVFVIVIQGAFRILKLGQ